MPAKVANKKNNQKPKVQEIKPEDAKYIDPSVQDYSFSDFVRITSFPQGILFSFAKRHPSQPTTPLIFKEILLPFDVADRLSTIVQGQLKKLEKDGRIERVKFPVKENKK